MANTPTQKASPTKVRMSSLAEPPPERSSRIRCRADPRRALPRGLGQAAWPIPRGSALRGSAAGRCATWARAPARARAASRGPASLVVPTAQHLHKVAHLRPAGELPEQLLEARVAGAVLLAQVVYRALGDDLAVLEDRDAVTHRLRHLQRVGAHEHGTVALHELAEDVLQQSRRLGVEAHHGLVHDDALRPVDEGARDDQLLAHAVTVGFYQLVLPAGQLEHVEQLGDAPLDGVPFLTVQRGHEAQELDPGELVVHERPIGNEAESHLGGDRVRMHVVATQEHPAVGGAQDAGDHPQRRGLPCAVRAEASVQHTLWDVERDIIDGDEAAVMLGQPLQLDHSTSSLMRPIRRTSSACWARPPMLNRTCAAPAGNSSSIGSTATQSPRYTSAHA